MRHYIARGSWWSRVPADLLAVALYGAVAAVAMPELPTSARVAFGLPLVLFAPGYVLLAVLYPRHAGAVAGSPHRNRAGRLGGRRGLTWSERLPLSLATSIALVPLLAILVGVGADGITVDHAVGSLVAVVLIGSLVAGFRRLRVPEADRVRLPWRRASAIRDAVAGAGRLDSALTLAVVLGVLLAATAMAYGVAAPDRGASYTEFALLSGNESGELVAGDYPQSFGPGESADLTASVANHEGGPVEYTVVVELERMQVDDDGVRLVEQRELWREARTVQAGNTWLAEHAVEPTLVGEDLRLAYYLYRGNAPADAGTASAYRHLHLWIDVDGRNATAAVHPPDDGGG